MGRLNNFRRFRMAAMLMALATGGCVSTGLDDRSDAWLNQPTLQTANTADWEEVSPDRIHEIPPALLPQAVALLADQQILQITPTQAHDLAGDFRDQPAPLYLVRGVGAPAQGYHRILLASHDGKSLLVSSGILTHHNILPQHAPLIISLSADPKVVYVTAFEAE